MVCAKRFKCLAHLIPESLLDGPVRGWKQRKDEKFSEMVKKHQNRQPKVKNQKVKMKNQGFDLCGGFDDGEDQRDYDSGSSGYDSGDWSYSGWHGSGGGGYGYDNDGDNTDDYNLMGLRALNKASANIGILEVRILRPPARKA